MSDSNVPFGQRKVGDILPNLFPRVESFHPANLDSILDGVHEAQAERDRRSQLVAEASEYQMLAAQTSVKQVVDEILAFERALGDDEEAFLCVVGGPAGMLIFPTGITHLPPDKLVFIGKDQDGHRVSAIQHVTQLSVLLRAVPVTTGEAPRRMGFHSSGGSE